MTAAAPPLRRRTYRRTARATPGFLLVNALFLDVIFLAGAVAAWPVYQSASYVVAVAVALVLAHAIALAGLRWSWSGWWVALAAFALYLVAGLPLAAPSMLGTPDEAIRALRGIVTAPVTAWKDLLTLELPLGDYQTVLAPALMLFLGLPVAALSLAWRARRWWVLAPALGLLLTVFGVVFGSAVLSPDVRVGSITVPGPVEMLVGVCGLLSALGFAVWRAVHARRAALRTAERASGVRTTGRTGSAVAGRVTMVAGMLVLALGAGAVAAPLALAGQSRDVLRERIDPQVRIAQQLSPLSQYRQFFSDELFDTVLFTVQADADVDRVRLATLTYFDGRVARVIDPVSAGTDPGAAFTRVPASLPAPDGSTPVRASVVIEAYRGVWLPTVGALTALSFDGASAATLADGFFYSAGARMGVQLSDAGLDAGDAYRQDGAVDTDVPAISGLEPGRTTSQLDPAVVPESVDEWIRAQQAPTGGAGLSLLVDRLRARGYLSHGLTVDEDQPSLWRAALGDYTFEPSRAGHSSGRVDAIFRALLQRQNEVGGDDDELLVAAAGDDEQFAVAAAMVADRLGFSTRIVLGARLVDGPGIPACEQGQCRGGNMTAWLEVQDASGTWVPIDVTPQHENSMTPDEQQRRDPEVPTEVRRDHAEPILPAEANPAEAGERDDDTAPPIDLSALWAALRVAAIGLLALVVMSGPFLLIVLLKALRRRARRRAAEPVDRVTGGWEEYVDLAVDHGRPTPRAQTRHELATLYAGADSVGSGVVLAAWADRSVFDVEPPSAAESDRFWEIVDEERARWRGEGSWWQRLRARLSLRSLLRRRRGRAAPGAHAERRRDRG